MWSVTAGNDDSVVVWEVKELVDTERRRLHVWNEERKQPCENAATKIESEFEII